MKRVIYLFVITFGLMLLGCSNCDGENPTIKLVNNGTGKADIQIKTSGGNTENINNILVGSASSKRSFDEGNIEFTINIQGVNEPIVYNLKVSSCRDYVVRINVDNSVEGSSSERD
ncbi:MAG: hypothetical protein IPM32_00165 [Ignavibacteriae bacterium]|nr:hypothetical protein [Ignavibacteriota bacterium]